MSATKPVGQNELKRAVIEQIDAAVGHDRTFWRPGEVHNRRVSIGRLHRFVRYVPTFAEWYLFYEAPQLAQPSADCRLSKEAASRAEQILTERRPVPGTLRSVLVSMLREYRGLMLVAGSSEGMSAVARIRSALAIGYGQRLDAQAVLTSAGFPGVAEFARHAPLQGRELDARRGSR